MGLRRDAEHELEQSAPARPVPAWATAGWVGLRSIRVPASPRLGFATTGGRVLLPASIATEVNSAREELERLEGTAAGYSALGHARLREQALLPPMPTETAQREPSEGVDARPAQPPRFAEPLGAAAAKPARAKGAPGAPAQRPRASAGAIPVAITTQAYLDQYVEDTRAAGVRKSRDEAKAVLARATELAARGPWRRVVAKPRWRTALEQLARDMPNFAAVVEHVRISFAMAERGRRPVRVTPMLLAGLPGVGKTYFAGRLAAALALPNCVHSLDSAETISTLGGSDKHWSESEPGALFRLVVMGEVANPLVVLDELDKAKRGGGGYQPANALHGLLEPVSSRLFRDKSADFEFDASHVIYIATANRLSSIEASLLSRFSIFHVEMPDTRGGLAVARGVAAQLLKEAGLGATFAAPRGEVLQQLALLGSPRLQIRVLRAAIGRAVLEGRSVLRVEDLLPQGGGGAADADANAAAPPTLH